MTTPQPGSRFDLHGVRYTVGPLAPCGRPWAVNEASGLGLHVIAPTEGPDSASLADATSISGRTPEGFLVTTATPRGLDEELVRAHALARSGLRDLAAASYHRVLARAPTHTEALIGLAGLEMSDGRHEQAAELAHRALVTEPHIAGYYDVYLRCDHTTPRQYLNQFERANAFLGPRVHGLKAARAWLRLGQPERAQALVAQHASEPAFEAEVEKALRASRRAHELFAQARLLVTDDARHEEVRDILSRAQAAYPPDIPSALNLGLTLHHLGRHAEAVAQLQPLADRLVVRDLPVLLANLGFAAAASGNLPLALQSLRGAWTALEVTSGHAPQAHLELLPCLAKWADAEGRIESSPREPLDIVGRLRQACESTSLDIPEEVKALEALYQVALRAPLSWGQDVALAPQAPQADVVEEVPQPGDWAPDTRVLDDLLVERRLGEGQRGTLYTVVHGPTQQRMTVERIRAATSEERRDLWNGLRVWCNLPVHDNLLACRSFVSSGDEVLVLFEEVEPLTLDAYLRQFGAAYHGRAATHLVAFAVHLAWALDLAHSSGVTHGPLPLGCVHFTLERTLKVGGFWHGDQLGEEEKVRRHISAMLRPDDNPLMRALHEDTLRSHVPIPRAGAEPSAWSPPESVGGRGATRQSDAWHWALAVLQASSLCYGLPAAENVTGLLTSLIDSPHVGNLPSQLPAELITILTRCLDADPTRRPRRLAEVAEALQLVFGPHFRQEAPPLVPAQQGARALQSLTQTEVPDPNDPAADLPWKDPRLALSIAYQASGLDPLAPQPYLPQGDASEQGRTLSHLAALEVASGLLREQVGAVPALTPELARQRFDASMMLASLGDHRGALQQSDEAVRLLRATLEQESVTALRYFLTTILGEQGSYHAALGQTREAVEKVREADRICRATVAAAETYAIEANVRMRLATVARRFPETVGIALECLERALKIWRDQENLEYLGYTQATIGQVHSSQGDFEAARLAWERALPLLKPFAERRSGPGMRLLATGCLQLVGMHQRTGRLAEADEVNTRVLDLLSRRVEKEGVGDLSLHLATACANAADARARRGEGGEALGLLQRARLTLERRLAHDSSVPVLRQLVDGLTMESQLLCLMGEGETAVAAVQHAWHVNRRLLQESGQLDDVLRMMATERLAVRALALAGNLGDGLPHIRAAVQLSQLASDALQRPDQVEMRADVLADAAFFTQRLDRHGESLQYGEAAARLYDAVPASRPMRIKLRVARGECHLGLGQWTEALQAAEEGLAIAGDGGDVEPDDLDRLFTVRVVARIALGHPAEALKECRAAQQRLQALAEQTDLPTPPPPAAAPPDAPRTEAPPSSTASPAASPPDGPQTAAPPSPAAAALLDITVLHARVAMQLGAVPEALDAFSEAVKLDPSQQFCASREALCRLLLDARAEDIPALLAAARDRLGEGHARYDAARSRDATDTAPRNLVVDALYLASEAWLLATRAADLFAARPLLTRLRSRRDPEILVRRAQAGHLRLQAAVHLAWAGCARMWASDALQAAHDAYDVAPADIAPILVDFVCGLHALSLEGQRAPNTPPVATLVRATRDRIQRAPASAPWRAPLLERLAAVAQD